MELVNQDHRWPLLFTKKLRNNHASTCFVHFLTCLWQARQVRSLRVVSDPLRVFQSFALRLQLRDGSIDVFKLALHRLQQQIKPGLQLLDELRRLV